MATPSDNLKAACDKVGAVERHDTIGHTTIGLTNGWSVYHDVHGNVFVIELADREGLILTTFSLSPAQIDRLAQLMV